MLKLILALETEYFLILLKVIQILITLKRHFSITSGKKEHGERFIAKNIENTT